MVSSRLTTVNLFVDRDVSHYSSMECNNRVVACRKARTCVGADPCVGERKFGVGSSEFVDTNLELQIVSMLFLCHSVAKRYLQMRFISQLVGANSI
jgi:hypothetical protein